MAKSSRWTWADELLSALSAFGLTAFSAAACWCYGERHGPDPVAKASVLWAAQVFCVLTAAFSGLFLCGLAHRAGEEGGE
jgi:hypothetical protein